MAKILYSVFCLITIVAGRLELEHSVSVKILVLGRTGSGKSTLINSILGRKIAAVGHRPFPETTTVTVYREEIHGVSATVCDTPGLGDASVKEDDRVRNIKSPSCSDPDLVIYCLSMDNTRWHNDDAEAIKTVTKHLGSKIWENSVLVLTFGDRFVANLEDGIKNKFEQRISDLKDLFEKYLQKIGVTKIGPYGNLFCAVSAKGRRHLPGIRDWMTALIIDCLSTTRENGKEGFRQIMMGRLSDPHPDDDEPLTWTDTWCNLLQKDHVAWMTSISGYKAGGIFAAKIAAAHFVGARLGAYIAGPAGFIFGGLAGLMIEPLLSNLTCSNSYKDEL